MFNVILTRDLDSFILSPTNKVNMWSFSYSNEKRQVKELVQKNHTASWGMIAHAFNASTQEVEEGGSL